MCVRIGENIGDATYMKILILFFSSFLLSTAIAIMMDWMIGIKLSMSLKNLKNPFWVMTLPEYVILFVLLSMMFVPPTVSFYKQRKQRKTHEKS
jgi:hypothetical protein